MPPSSTVAMLHLLVSLVGFTAASLLLLGGLLWICFLRWKAIEHGTELRFEVPRWPAACKFFVFEGRRFAMGASDQAAHQFLGQLAAARADAAYDDRPPPRLMTYRSDFRRILGASTTAGLVRSLEARDDQERCLAIWLLGRAHDSSTVSAINSFVRYQPVRVRREAARALRRLGAWKELRWLAKNDPDERVHRLATPGPVTDFASRLNDFTGRAPRAFVTPPARDLEIFVPLDASSGKLPKAQEVIARILQHIRVLVRGLG